jgi:purine nucleosidase
MRYLWIDTDMGSDDAVALMMAFRAPDVQIVGVSVLAGNVPLMQAAKNALFLAELCGVTVPVYLGAKKPLLRHYVDATWFHGEDGLAGRGGEAKHRPESRHAVDALIEAAEQYPNLELVTLGPLTNIALAVAQQPKLAQQISRTVVMGGAACTYGNVTPAAEYNIWVDPDAARMVFLSGMALELVGWEFCIGDFALNDREIAALRALNNPLADFAIDCNETAIEAYFTQTGAHGLSLPDPVAMAVLLTPGIARQSKHYVEVETHSELTRGMTLVDKLDVAEDKRNREVWAQAIQAGKHIAVTWEVDTAGWKALLMELLKSEGRRV